MPTAFNPETGELRILQDGEWVAPKIAANPGTGEKVYLEGGEWKPFPGATKAPTPQETKPGLMETLTDPRMVAMIRAPDVGIIQGLKDIPAGGAQLVTRIGEQLPGSLGEWFRGQRENVETKNKLSEQQYQEAFKPIGGPPPIDIGRITGNIAATAPLLPATGPTTMLQAIGQGARTGATIGSLTPAAGEDFWKEKTLQTGLGAATGAVTGAAAKKVGDVLANRAFRKSIPTTETLRAQADDLYTAAKASGVSIKDTAFSGAVSKMRGAAQGQLVNKTLHPDATAALDVLEQAAKTNKPLSLAEADQFRQIIKDAAASLKPADRRIAMKMLDEFDDFLGKLGPKDVVAGDPKAAVETLSKARDLWSRFRKGDELERLIERAGIRAQGQFSGSGFENALRTEFRQLAMNRNKMRLYTEAERDAIEKVAKGGPVGNVLRAIGRFAGRGPVSAVLTGGAGAHLGGPAGTAAALAAGEVGRQGATALTNRNAIRAAELMRAGGIPQLALSPAQQQMTRGSMIGGGLLGSRMTPEMQELLDRQMGLLE